MFLLAMHMLPIHTHFFWVSDQDEGGCRQEGRGEENSSCTRVNKKAGFKGNTVFVAMMNRTQAYQRIGDCNRIADFAVAKGGIVLQ